MNGNNSHHTGTYTQEEREFFEELMQEYREFVKDCAPYRSYFMPDPMPYPENVYNRLERRDAVRYHRNRVVCMREGHEWVKQEGDDWNWECKRCGYTEPDKNNERSQETMPYTRESTNTRNKEQPDKRVMLHILAIAGATPEGAITRLNNCQFYKDVPIIEIGFAGGAIQCWEPDEGVKHWAFTYSAVDLNQDWSDFIPADVREGILRIAEEFDCEVYSYNGEE